MNPLERYRTTARNKPISYEDFGKMLGVSSKSTVWAWCNDECLPPETYWRALPEATGGKVTILALVRHRMARLPAPKRKAA
jgi:hypothetical protein